MRPTYPFLTNYLSLRGTLIKRLEHEASTATRTAVKGFYADWLKGVKSCPSTSTVSL
jgi:hypothetical protein